MTSAKLKSVGIALSSIAAVLFNCAAHAQTPPPDWTFSVMPYIWVPGVDAKLKYGPPPADGSSANVDADDSDILSKIDGVFMISGEARKGQWLVFTDFAYIHLADIDSKVKSVDFNPGSGPINVSTSQIGGSTDSSLKGSVWTLLGGYAAFDNAKANLDVLAGLRYLDLEFSSAWNLNSDITLPNSSQTFSRSGDVSKSGHITAFIVGAKGQFKLGQTPWFIPYYVDMGGDSSTFTWQVATGIGYGFEWGDVRLQYRNLAYSQDGDKLIQDIALGGFALGANFNF